MIDTWIADHGIPAVAAAVVTAEGTVERRFAGRAVPDSLFALASLTKPLIATACVVAGAEQAIDLGAPVADHLPAYRAEAKREITSRHLLAHASGLPESDRSGTPAVEVEPVAGLAERRIYSNEGYAVLGELLTAATGMPFATYVARAVFEPLGMDAVLGLPEADHGRALEVREPGLAGSGVALFNSREWRRRGTAAGGAFATLDAYARFVQLLLARGRPLLAEPDFTDMAAVHYPGIPGGIESFLTWPVADWSLGFDVRDGKAPHWTGTSTSPGTLSHFGASGTLFFADLDAGLGLVCLANRGTYSGWPMRPGMWPDLCSAVLGSNPA
jgi:CubicO group peptidase (beta-lactamase class C family)